jgi:V/A-type H+-transporting ATPase subunit B
VKVLLRFTNVLEIVGDIVKVRVPIAAENHEAVVKFGDLALLENSQGESLVAQVISINREVVALQVFAGTKGVSTNSSVRFLGHPMLVTYSDNVLGRVFGGTGEPIDNGPDLSSDPQVEIGGPSVNPCERIVPKKMIRTDIPMIDVFNCLVESQKIPIFSVSGEPFNAFLARIGIQADADIVVFGGMGLIFDDYYLFRKALKMPVFSREQLCWSTKLLTLLLNVFLYLIWLWQ